MKTIGLDVGNGSVGFVSRNEDGSLRSETFPSVYGVYDRTAQNLAIDPDKRKKVNSYFTFEKRDYVIGYENVLITGGVPISAYDRENRMDRREFQVLTKLALLRAATSNGTRGVIEVILGFGLPADDYRTEKVELAQEWFREPVVGMVDGEQVVVMVKLARIISQPIAVLMDAYLNDQGEVCNECLENEHSLVLDCGSGTLDMSEFDGLTLIRQAGEAVGINDVYQEITAGIARKEPKARVNAFDLEYQLRQQDGQEEFTYSYGRIELPITDLREQAMSNCWERTVGSITRWFPDRLRFSNVFLAGGTGEAFADRFASWMSSIILMPEPQLAVARGLCKYALANVEE